ncbi:blue copper protein 1a-like [Aristolochia californica]|uniref:blue copper protein 1a-like n=1 Tax=Aristolochia californica TaxID=171875 RepID=UPI0035E254F3
MALIKTQVTLAVLAALVILLSFASATEFIVGDDSGWSIDVDYEAWAMGKTFYVGDILVFNYEEGYHSVVKVNGTGFAQCLVSPNTGVLTTGNDWITLTTPGNKWYICGIANHCSYYSQKLKITVLPKDDYLPPSPSPAVSEMSPAPAPWSGPVETPPESGGGYMTPVPAPMAVPRKWGAPPQMPVVPAPWSAPVETQPQNGYDYNSPPAPAPWSSTTPAPWAPVPASVTPMPTPWAAPSE